MRVYTDRRGRGGGGGRMGIVCGKGEGEGEEGGEGLRNRQGGRAVGVGVLSESGSG